MTKEQETIENLTNLLKQRNEKEVTITTFDLFENIETVLSMLKEKDKEIERLEKQSKNLDKQAQQYFEQTIYLDKQIDLMAEYIARLDIDQDICIKVEDSCFDYAGQNGKTCDTCIKQYFEKLAKEKGE